MAEETDESLVARAGAGDRLAASALVVRHSDRIMRTCYRLLGDRAAAEDATQETFLRLWKHAGTWRPQGAKFETWLFRVASNICLDRLRRRGREAPEDAAPEPEDETPGAEERLIAEERSRRVAAALGALPDRQRLAVTLCHFEEMTNIEAAAVMALSVEAVESLLSRARRSLRTLLAAEREERLEEGRAR